uniref:Uncharacterized protein n=1 Tax=Arundo donax TaxID=35708 RepID=A0A0A9AIC8_ARUDO
MFWLCVMLLVWTARRILSWARAWLVARHPPVLSN